MAQVAPELPQPLPSTATTTTTARTQTSAQPPAATPPPTAQRPPPLPPPLPPSWPPPVPASASSTQAPQTQPQEVPRRQTQHERTETGEDVSSPAARTAGTGTTPTFASAIAVDNAEAPRQRASSQHSAARLRRNVRVTNLLIRSFFISSLLVIGGLVIAAMVTVVIGLNVTFSYAASASAINRIRFRSEQIVTDAQTILLYPTNTTVLQTEAADLVDAGQLLSNFLDSIENGNGSIGIDYPIQNADTMAEFAALTPAEQSILASINNISAAVIAGATVVTPAIAANLNNILVQQQTLLTHLGNLNDQFDVVLSDQVRQVQILQYIFMSVILAVLLVLAFGVYLPLELRNIGLLRVLTQQNENLDQLATNLSILTQLSPNGIFRVNNKGHVTYVNERWLQLTGVESGSNADDWLQKVHPEDRAAVLAQLSAALNDPQHAMAIEFRMQLTDGRLNWLFAQTLPEIKQGRAESTVKSLVGTLVDLTDRKALEHERMHALEQAAEVQEKRAQEAEAHRREQMAFVDMICHEIRNPLNGVVNNVDLLLEHRETLQDLLKQIQQSRKLDDIRQLSKRALQAVQEQAGLFEAIDVCLSHERRITDDVLHMSRMHSGMFTLEERKFRLRQLLDGVMSIFRVEAQKHDVTLQLTFTPPAELAPVLRADAQRIAQILINLIGNAIKFTRGRPVRLVSIHVDLSDTDPPDPPRLLLIVSVQDTGIGITDEEMRRLFVPFTQATVRTHSRYGGFGMGLFLSKAMLDQLGGTVSASSIPDVGTKFTVTIPLMADDHDASVDAQLNIRPDRPIAAMASPTRVAVATEHSASPHGSGRQSTPATPQPHSSSSANSSTARTPAGISPPSSRAAASHQESTHPSAQPSAQPSRPSSLPLSRQGSQQFTAAASSTTPAPTPSPAMRDRVSYQVHIERHGAAQVISSGVHLDSLPASSSAAELPTSEAPPEPASAHAQPPRQTPPIIEADFARATPAEAAATRTAVPPTDDAAITRAMLNEADFRPESQTGHAGATSSSTEASSSAAVPPVAEPADSREEMRALVVEDNDINQKILVRQLSSVRQYKLVVTVAENGQEALERFKDASLPFNVVIMDVEMPVMDGITATRKIREFEMETQRPPVPIIGVSGNARDAHRDAAIASGMNDYLIKPCRRPELLASITQNLHLPTPLT